MGKIPLYDGGQNPVRGNYGQILKKKFQKNFDKFRLLFYLCKMNGEEFDNSYEESKIQRLEGEIFEMKSTLKNHRDKERIYQEILSDINNSIIELFKREEENIRFNMGEETDYRQCMIGMKEYMDNIKREYKGKIKF